MFHVNRAVREGALARVLATLALLAMACLAPVEDCLAQAFDIPTETSLQGVLDKAVSELGVPGAVMLIKRDDGAQWTGACGVAEIKAESPLPPGEMRAQARGGLVGPAMDPSLKFRIASLTKTFTGHLILQLAQDGTLSLEDTLDEWLPGIIQNSERITIRQLLNHTAGVHNYTDYAFYRRVLREPDKVWTPEAVVALARAKGPDFEPGSGWKYSNTGYVLLGMIIEKATSMPYREAVRHYILEPLDMRSTSVPEGLVPDAGFARGYVYEDGGWIDMTTADPVAGFSAADMVSTIDLAAWVQALATGRLLNEDGRRELARFVPTGRDGLAYGAGIMNSRGAIGHNGIFYGAYTSCAFHYKNASYVVLVNGNAEPRSGVENAAQEIFWRATKVLSEPVVMAGQDQPQPKSRLGSSPP